MKSTLVRGTKTSSELTPSLTGNTRINLMTLLLILPCICIICILTKAWLNNAFNSVESLQEYIRQFGVFGPCFLIVFQAAQVILPVLPGFLGCAVGAIMFGPWTGFLCNYLGISLGSIIAFLLARKYGMPLLRELFPVDKYEKWSNWASASKSYSGFLFLATLLPMFPDDYLCYLSGLSEMSVRRFTWIIIAGKPWCILAYSFGFSLIG